MYESFFDLSNFLVEIFLLNSDRLFYVDNLVRINFEFILFKKGKIILFIVIF